MSDEADQRSTGGSGTTWIVGILAALVIYVLSPAPVAKMLISIHGRNPPDRILKTYVIIYTPLFKSLEHFQPAMKFYDWYYSLWKV